MPDTIGNVNIPEIPVSGTFPLVSDYPHGRAHAPSVHVHRFGSANAKIEQRFWAGDGATRFTIVRSDLSDAELSTLKTFWDSNKGCYGAFAYNAPNDDNAGTTAYTCRFEDQTLTWDRLTDALSSFGVTLAALPSSAPTYPLNGTQTRFPDTALQTALLSQVQRIIPLIKIQAKESGYPAIYVSDRRCTVGSQVYLPRLIDWNGISQEIGNAEDNAEFVFGNADRVMTALANDTNLDTASIEFSLYHVGTGIKLDLWKGEILTWACDEGPEFRVTASDGIPLTVPYPDQKISRTCQKDFDDGAACPYATAGTGGDPAKCDKGFNTANGCTAHGMADYFGGQVMSPQTVKLKQLGGIVPIVWVRRFESVITSTSIQSDTIYGVALRDIYCDSEMEVTCDIAVGREESEFYDALGIVGRGPLASYGSGHTLDNQLNHGPGNLGLRTSLGADPNPDPFSLGSGPAGGTFTYGPERAAGIAFIELRRSDPKGQQVSKLTDHAMKAVVAQGLSGWTWSAPGSRTTSLLINPVWIAINMFLRAKGMQFASAAAQEALFDCDAACAAAAVCAQSVTKLIGTGTETQFKFRGVVQETKPLRDWMQEILMNCLGFYTWSFGKLKIGIRYNSSAVEAFTTGNIIFQSLQLSPLKPQFNHLTAQFADEEFDYAGNTLEFYDIDHAKLIGNGKPLYLKGSMNLSGSPGKSQTARIVTTRLREELGGNTPAEWKAARNIRFRTTVLALKSEVGQVDSLTHPDMPGGSGEFRITSWRLNKDYSIEIEGRTTTDSMYDLTVGDKPADVVAGAVPVEYFPSPQGMVWHPNAEFPASGDPMFGEDQGTFSLTQEYSTLRDDQKKATLIVAGEAPVNTFPAGVSPAIIGSLSEVAGGTLEAGNYLVAVCATRADGQFTPPSNVLSISIGASKSISLDNITWPSGTYTGYVVFGARDSDKLMCAQSEVTGALPASITWTGPLKRSTWTMPNPNFKFVRVKGKRIYHDGVDGVSISGVSTGKITCQDLIGLGDNWAGRIISVIADASDGSAALWNFSVSAYSDSLGEFTVSPDPAAAGVQPGDVLIIRIKPTAVGSNWIEDDKFLNGHAPGGLAVDAEKGRLFRVIAGTGAGQVRFITTNSAKRITVDQPWAPMLDSTSVGIIEAAGWEYQADGPAVSAAVKGIQMQIRMACDNMLDQAVIVCCTGVDKFGNESPEDYYSPFRPIWMYGQPPGVKIITADYTIQRGDRTILVDTTAGPVTVTLLPTEDMQGLELFVKRITAGANACTVAAAPGETIDGAATVSLPNQWDSISITATK